LCPEPAYAAVSSRIEDYVVGQFFGQLEQLEVEPFEDSSELAQVEDEIRAAEADLGVYRDDTMHSARIGTSPVSSNGEPSSISCCVDARSWRRPWTVPTASTPLSCGSCGRS
jgi:hypothetical protein